MAPELKYCISTTANLSGFEQLDSASSHSTHRLMLLGRAVQSFAAGDPVMGVRELARSIVGLGSGAASQFAKASGYALAFYFVLRGIDSLVGYMSKKMGGSGMGITDRLADASSGLSNFMKYQKAISLAREATNGLAATSLEKLRKQIEDTTKATESMIEAMNRAGQAAEAGVKNRHAEDRISPYLPMDGPGVEVQSVKREAEDAYTARTDTRKNERIKLRSDSDAHNAELARLTKDEATKKQQYQALFNRGPALVESVRNERSLEEAAALEAWRAANKKQTYFEHENKPEQEKRTKRLDVLADEQAQDEQNTESLKQQKDAETLKARNDADLEIEKTLKEYDEKNPYKETAGIETAKRELAALRRTIQTPGWRTNLSTEQVESVLQDFDEKTQELAEMEKDFAAKRRARGVDRLANLNTEIAILKKTLDSPEWRSTSSVTQVEDTLRDYEKKIEERDGLEKKLDEKKKEQQTLASAQWEAGYKSATPEGKAQMLAKAAQQAAKDYLSSGANPKERTEAVQRLEDIRDKSKELQNDLEPKRRGGHHGSYPGSDYDMLTGAASGRRHAGAFLGENLRTTSIIPKMAFHDKADLGASSQGVRTRRMGESLKQYEHRQELSKKGDDKQDFARRTAVGVEALVKRLLPPEI